MKRGERGLESRRAAVAAQFLVAGGKTEPGDAKPDLRVPVVGVEGHRVGAVVAALRDRVSCIELDRADLGLAANSVERLFVLPPADVADEARVVEDDPL